MVTIFYGDGTGKTPAAAGLALRAAGQGKQVIFTQFFRDGSDGEIRMMQRMPEIQTIHCDTVPGKFEDLPEEEKAQVRGDYSALLEAVLMMSKNTDVLVLDEAVTACMLGAISENRLISFLQGIREGLDVVLTGRNPSVGLLKCADSVTELKQIF